MKHKALFILIIALSGCKSGLKAEKEITLDQGMVAVIGERQYPSLMSAVRGAQDHDIIKIFRPVTEEIVIEGKNLTLKGIGKEAVISHPSVTPSLPAGMSELTESSLSEGEASDCKIWLLTGGMPLRATNRL